jgi:hypothetical protein
MKLLLLFAALLAGVAVIAYVALDPFGDDSNPGGVAHRSGTVASSEKARKPLAGTACQKLAALAANLAATDRTANEFLVDLGQQAAGIRRGRLALLDLARDGHNVILGRGFKPEFDDGTRGQVRHFAGVARASMFGGSIITRWISENLRSDPSDSPDGRLADEGIDFAQSLLTGRLRLSEASDWIRERLCRP